MIPRYEESPSSQSNVMRNTPTKPRLPIHLGIMSSGDPRNVRTWSGVPFAILNRLDSMVDSITYLPAGP